MARKSSEANLRIYGANKDVLACRGKERRSSTDDGEENFRGVTLTNIHG